MPACRVALPHWSWWRSASALASGRRPAGGACPGPGSPRADRPPPRPRRPPRPPPPAHRPPPPRPRPPPPRSRPPPPTHPATTTTTTTPATTTTTTPTTTASSNTPWGLIALIVVLVVAVVVVALLLRSRKRGRPSPNGTGRWSRPSATPSWPAPPCCRATPSPTIPSCGARWRSRWKGRPLLSTARCPAPPIPRPRRRPPRRPSSLRGLAFAIEADRLLRHGTSAPSGVQLAQADEARRARAAEMNTALARLSARIGSGHGG